MKITCYNRFIFRITDLICSLWRLIILIGNERVQIQKIIVMAHFKLQCTTFLMLL